MLSLQSHTPGPENTFFYSSSNTGRRTTPWLLPFPSHLLTCLRITRLAVPVASARHAGAVGPETGRLSAVPRGAALTELPLVACWTGAALHPCCRHAGPRESTCDGNIIQVASTWEPERGNTSSAFHLVHQNCTRDRSAADKVNQEAKSSREV